MKLYNDYVSENGKRLTINPNQKVVDAIVKRIELRDGYCPCRVKENNDTICPCLDMRKIGHCCCKLYLEKE